MCVRLHKKANDAYDYHDEKGNYQTEIEWNTILNVVAEIYKQNGFSNIRVAGIKRSELEGKDILPYHTCITVFGSVPTGFDAGDSNNSINSDTGKSNIDFEIHDSPTTVGLYFLKMGYVSAKTYQYYIKRDKLNMRANLLIGYAIAHEILHQYLIKMSLLITGFYPKKSHDNVPQSLNMEYALAKKYLNGTTKVAVDRTTGIFNILPYQKAYLRAYLKCANIGVLKKDSNAAQKMLEQELSEIYK